MIKLLKILRKTKISKDELIGDCLLITISAVTSFMITFLFDIHHSFYSWPIFPLKFIFNTWQPYLYFTLSGIIVGFIVLKLLIFAIKEEMK